MMRSIVPAGFILLSAFWTPGAEADLGTDQLRTVPALTARPAVLSVHMDAHRLGIAESMLKYCARVDPPDAATLRQQIAHMWQSASEPQVVRVRNSTEYRSAYAAVTDFVTKVDEHNARQPCREWLTANK
jgi:hypothetical protein